MAKQIPIGCRVAITGGARGIGRAVAQGFLAAGGRVAIGDIDGVLARRTAAELAEELGGTVVGLDLDVTDEASFAQFLAAAGEELGELDVLVNNAGIMPTGPFLEESQAISDRQIAVNLRGVVIGSRLAAARFVPRGAGQIVNIASLAGIIPVPGVAVYSATKAAVVALGDALNQEIGPHGVAVTTVTPVLVRTELASGIQRNRLQEAVAVVDPEEVAAAIVAAVARGRAGLVTVPRSTGFVARSTRMLPEGLRNAFYGVAGIQSASANADEVARSAYRVRIAPTEK
ncbi:SDR family NAD(P)-dependent oxidoreductase [Nocardia sp. CA-136227]|uniref:SDR family NAD(P)-dependent oxidoreductase n=1 Tax=Nocardia sp. CA-136227 TaxID=3239979 RepID=UPI003D97E6EC